MPDSPTRTIIMHKNDGVRHPTSWIDDSIRKLLYASYIVTNEGSFEGGDFFRANQGGVKVVATASGITPSSSCISVDDETIQSYKWTGNETFSGFGNTRTDCCYDGTPKVGESGLNPCGELLGLGFTNQANLQSCDSPTWSGSYYTSSDCSTGGTADGGMWCGIGFGIENDQCIIVIADKSPSALPTAVFFLGVVNWCDIAEGVEVSNTLSGGGSTVTAAGITFGFDAGSGGTVVLNFCVESNCEGSGDYVYARYCGDNNLSSKVALASDITEGAVYLDGDCYYFNLSDTTTTSSPMLDLSNPQDDCDSCDTGDRTHDHIQLRKCLDGSLSGQYVALAGLTASVFLSGGTCLYVDGRDASTSTASPLISTSSPQTSCADCSGTGGGGPGPGPTTGSRTPGDYIELQKCSGGGAGVFAEWLGLTEGDVFRQPDGSCIYYDSTQNSTSTSSPAADLSSPQSSCSDCATCNACGDCCYYSLSYINFNVAQSGGGASTQVGREFRNAVGMTAEEADRESAWGSVAGQECAFFGYGSVNGGAAEAMVIYYAVTAGYVSFEILDHTSTPWAIFDADAMGLDFVTTGCCGYTFSDGGTHWEVTIELKNNPCCLDSGSCHKATGTCNGNCAGLP